VRITAASTGEQGQPLAIEQLDLHEIRSLDAVTP